jgi:hypothetical protein
MESTVALTSSEIELSDIDFQAFKTFFGGSFY